MARIVLSEDFKSFPLGAFPYDREHSAMGEYHYIEDEGYKGQWFDPIANWAYKGPSWLITDSDMDGSRAIEQMRIEPPGFKKAVPCLRSGEIDWEDYTLSVKIRPMINSEIAGVLFRYQTSMMHYGFFLVGERVELHRVCKTERTVLASSPLSWSTDCYSTLSVRVSGSHIECSVNGNVVLSLDDDTYKSGCIALSASIPARYKDIKVEMSDSEFALYSQKRGEKEERVAKKRAQYPGVKLHKVIDLKNFGAGRQIRFGHLTGTDELFFLMAQHQRKVYKDRYPVISCLTAVSLESGEILWQKGEPVDSEDVIYLTTDLPMQIYDIDGDGRDEVITSWDFKLMILDGATGEVKREIMTPLNTAPEESVCCLEFGRYAFSRLNVDAIRIVNVSGKARPSDILIKDRYSRLWIYDSELKPIWEFSHYNTGHFPYGYDFDGDGREEIYSCYNMVDHDGKLLWSLPIDTDHTDEIIIGKFSKDQKEDVIAIVSGWEGFMIVSKDGRILHRDINGHGQRISAGNYIPEREGELEICTTTFWGNNGIIYLHDGNGNEIWHYEAKENGNIITPVNWDGSGRDLILLNGHSGMIDGEGDVVVVFPDDGHPTLSCEVLNVTGDERDEIILWDRHKLYVYTQDREGEDSSLIYKPEKYPEYNASNYRGEFSFPRFVKKN